MKRHYGSGFGTLELLTSVAFLVIVMGLMVSLARYVRGTSAERITREQLRTLNAVLTSTDRLPQPNEEPLPGPAATEGEWAAYVTNAARAFDHLAVADEGGLIDAWGNPIGYLPAGSPRIGMAPHDRPFFFSAGPDGKYLTQDDNLYGYEQITPDMPATRPVDTTNNLAAHDR